MKRILSACICMIFLSGCTQDNPDPNPVITGANELLYFDTFKDSSVTSGVQKPYSERVCYNAATEQVVWVKPNTKFSNREFHFGGTGEGYSRNIMIGDNIFRIFTQSDNQSNRSFLSNIPYYLDGVFFQKIDKATGNEIMLKTIVTKAEMNAGYAFGMSRVESDGTHFYFTCANGNMYCFDLNGNLTWKKYFTKFSLMAGKYNYFYLDKGKIYISTFESNNYKFTCLDAATGNLLWYPHYPGNPPVIPNGDLSPEITNFPSCYFQSYYAVGFSTDVISCIPKATGEILLTNPYVVVTGPSGSTRIKQPYGLMTENIAFFRDYSSMLCFYDMAGRNLTYQSNVPVNIITKQFFYEQQKLILFGRSETANNLQIKIIEPRFPEDPIVKADRTYPFGPLPPAVPGWGIHYNYVDYPPVYKNNKIYVLANYYIENNVCKINNTMVSGANNTWDLTLLVFDASTGGIIKQIRNISTVRNISTYGMYEFSIYNMTAG